LTRQGIAAPLGGVQFALKADEDRSIQRVFLNGIRVDVYGTFLAARYLLSVWLPLWAFSASRGAFHE
jgi:hypothetical protein